MNDIVSHASVPQDHPSLAGHFPGRPIVPGVVLLDLVFDSIRSEFAESVNLQSIVSAKFLQAVAPETRVDMHIKLTPDEHPGRIKARFTASHANATVLEGSFMLATSSRIAPGEPGGKQASASATAGEPPASPTLSIHSFILACRRLTCRRAARLPGGLLAEAKRRLAAAGAPA
jgi:3-hydroxymyristoyl/3-hydroxydecanoyl-(acyl carrier protein) dehydratase